MFSCQGDYGKRIQSLNINSITEDRNVSEDVVRMDLSGDSKNYSSWMVLPHQGTFISTSCSYSSEVGLYWTDWSRVGPFEQCLSYCSRIAQCVLSCVRFFAIPGTVARQAPPSMGFPRQEYWGGLPFSSPGDLPDLGIEPACLSVCIGRQVLYHQSHLGSLLKLLRSRALLPDCYDSDITTENWISIIS